MTFSHDAMLINVVRDATITAAAAKALPASDDSDEQQQQQDQAALLPPVLQSAGSKGLKGAFAADLDAVQHQLLSAEAVAAEQKYKQQQQQQSLDDASAGVATGEVRLVAPAAAAAAGGTGARSLAVLLSTSLLDTQAWLDILPEQAWAEAAAVADEAAALIAAEQQQQEAGDKSLQQQVTPPKQQGQEHHLAAASQQHHSGQRERVFTMRGGSAPQPAATAAAADSSEDLIAKTAKGLAAAVFRRKKPKAVPGSSFSASWVDVQGEAAVAAITDYILFLADSRRQRMLVVPPSAELARLAAGELALRIELESQRQKALMLKAGVSRVSLMQGTSAAVSSVTGVHINTKGVECATCGCDLSLAAVVSESEPGRAVCPEHYTDLDGTRSECYLLLRYMPGQLEQLLAKAVQLIPGAKEAVRTARARKSWVAAGRFMGSTVLQKPADTAAAAVVVVKQEPAEKPVEQQQQQEEAVAVKLLGRLYDPAELDRKLFVDLDAEVDQSDDGESDVTNEGSSYQNNKTNNNSGVKAEPADSNSDGENQLSGSWFGDQTLVSQQSDDEQMDGVVNDSYNRKVTVSRKRVRVEDASLGRMAKRSVLAVQA